jgi:hypothetical protein
MEGFLGMATVQDLIESPSGSFLLFCEEIAKGAPGMVRLLGDWLANRGSAEKNPAIRRFVLGHEHRVIDTLTMADIKAATEWSRAEIPKRHALGESRGTAPHRWLDDFDTPWTFNYQFHGLLDKMKKIPTWEEYENWFFSQGASTYYVPAVEALKRRHPSPNKADFTQFLACLRWRVGCAYYSFLREMHLYTTLRVVYGLPMRYHVLADSQMRIDMWCHNYLLAVCVENKDYRAEQGGRKQRLEDIVRGTRFQVIPVTLGKPTGFGRPHLVSPAEIKRVAEQIRLSTQKAA